MNTLLSAFSAHQVHFGHAPRIAAGTATASEESSSVIARAPQTHANLSPGHALLARFTVVAIGWTILGVFCAELFSAFHGY
jgi:hypothetical protein